MVSCRAAHVLLLLGCMWTCATSVGPGGDGRQLEAAPDPAPARRGPKGEDGCADDPWTWGCARQSFASLAVETGGVARYIEGNGVLGVLWTTLRHLLTNWLLRLRSASLRYLQDSASLHSRDLQLAQDRAMKGMQGDNSTMKSMKMKLKDKIKQKLKDKLKEKADKKKMMMAVAMMGVMGAMATTMMTVMAKKAMIVSLMTFVLTAMKSLKKGGGGSGGGGGGGKCGPCVCNCKGSGGGGFSAGKGALGGGGGGGYKSYYKRNGGGFFSWSRNDSPGKRNE